MYKYIPGYVASMRVQSLIEFTNCQLLITCTCVCVRYRVNGVCDI